MFHVGGGAAAHPSKDYKSMCGRMHCHIRGADIGGRARHELNGRVRRLTGFGKSKASPYNRRLPAQIFIGNSLRGSKAGAARITGDACHCASRRRLQGSLQDGLGDDWTDQL